MLVEIKVNLVGTTHTQYESFSKSEHILNKMVYKSKISETTNVSVVARRVEGSRCAFSFVLRIPSDAEGSMELEDGLDKKGSAFIRYTLEGHIPGNYTCMTKVHVERLFTLPVKPVNFSGHKTYHNFCCRKAGDLQWRLTLESANMLLHSRAMITYDAAMNAKQRMPCINVQLIRYVTFCKQMYWDTTCLRTMKYVGIDEFMKQSNTIPIELITPHDIPTIWNTTIQVEYKIKVDFLDESGSTIVSETFSIHICKVADNAVPMAIPQMNIEAVEPEPEQYIPTAPAY